MQRLFLKLGGSLITRKEEPFQARLEVLHRLAGEIRRALDDDPDLRLVLGHGSGSFGHAEAGRWGLDGSPGADLRGYLAVHRAALRLHGLVLEALEQAGVLVAGFSPWPAVRLRRREVVSWPLHGLGSFLDAGGVPLVHGDVGWEEDGRLSIVSTEGLFRYLARYLAPQRILLAAGVAGLFTADPQIDPRAERVPLVRASRPEPLSGLGGALGGDTTGGMRGKVEAMIELVREQPRRVVEILSGEEEGAVYRALVGQPVEGTRIVYE